MSNNNLITKTLVATYSDENIPLELYRHTIILSGYTLAHNLYYASFDLLSRNSTSFADINELKKAMLGKRFLLTGAVAITTEGSILNNPMLITVVEENSSLVFKVYTGGREQPYTYTQNSMTEYIEEL